jgi:hypothetical protein
MIPGDSAPRGGVFVEMHKKTPDDPAAAQQLAVDLGQLALALEQAGAYIQNDISIGEQAGLSEPSRS